MTKNIYENLTIKMSYRQFCSHLTNYLKSSSSPSSFSPPSRHGQSSIAAVHAGDGGVSDSAIAPVRVGKTGGFVMPAVNLDEGEEE